MRPSGAFNTQNMHGTNLLGQSLEENNSTWEKCIPFQDYLRRMLALQGLINPHWRCLFDSPYTCFWTGNGWVNCNAASLQQYWWSKLVAWVLSLLVQVVVSLWDLSVMRVTHAATHTPFLALPQCWSMGILCGTLILRLKKCCAPILHPLINNVGSSHTVIRKTLFESLFWTSRPPVSEPFWDIWEQPASLALHFVLDLCWRALRPA